MKTRYLKRFYLLFMLILLFCIVSTPYAIKNGFSFLEEEFLEGLIILIITIIAIILDFFYKKEVASKNEIIDTAWKQIGKMNIFAERIKKLLVSVDKYPENKTKLKSILEEMADRILGLDNYDFVFLRIVEEKKIRTISEYFKARKKMDLPKISNKDLVKINPNTVSSAVSSTMEGLDVKIFCILSKDDISEEQKILIQKILNDIVMLYYIFFIKTTKQNK